MVCTPLFHGLFHCQTSLISFSSSLPLSQFQAYNAQLQKGVEFEKGRAIKYKKAGKLEYAKVCLGRMKLMEKEIIDNQNDM